MGLSAYLGGGGGRFKDGAWYLAVFYCLSCDVSCSAWGGPCIVCAVSHGCCPRFKTANVVNDDAMPIMAMLMPHGVSSIGANAGDVARVQIIHY